MKKERWNYLTALKINLGDHNLIYSILSFNVGVEFGQIAALVIVFPLLMLIKIGIINRNSLIKKRRYIIVVIFVIAAIFTPPDPLSQLLIALPLYILYELGIFISYIFREKS